MKGNLFSELTTASKVSLKVIFPKKYWINVSELPKNGE